VAVEYKIYEKEALAHLLARRRDFSVYSLIQHGEYFSQSESFTPKAFPPPREEIKYQKSAEKKLLLVRILCL